MSRHWLTFWCVLLGIALTGSLFAQEKVQRIPVVKDGLTSQVRQGNLTKDVGGPVPASVNATDILVNNNAGFTPTSQFIQSESDVIAFGSYVIVVFNDAGSYASGSHFTGWSRSTDGGVTFTDGGLLPTSTVGDAGDPVIARNNTTGRLFFSTLGFNSPGNIQMFSSDDNGATWSAPVNCTPGGTSMDKQWHTVDNFAGTGNGNVYMIARDFGAGGGVFLWRSLDGGATWGASGTNIVSGNQGAYVAVGTDHAVYAFWYATGAIMVRKSTDLGVTFGSPVTVASGLIGGTNGDLGLVGARQGLPTPSGFRSNEFPHAAVNPVTGNIYVTFNNKGVGVDKGDIFLVQSIDGGATWSAAVKINDDVTTTDQWQPTVCVTPAGNKMGIFYYSRQEDPTGNNLFKFYGRLGNISGGAISWPTASFAISDVASLPEFGRDAVVNSVYMSDYQHAYATPTAFHVAWSDNRDDLPGGAGRKDPNMYYEQILTTDNFGWAKGTITNVSGGAALSGVNVDFVQTPNAPSISDGAGFYKAGVQVDTPAVTRLVTLRATKFGFRDTLISVTVTRNDTITRNFAMTPAAGGTLSVWSHTATTNLRSFVQVKFGSTVVISDSTNATTGLLVAPLPAGTYSVLVDARSPYLTRNFPSVVIGSGTTNVDALTQPVVTNNPAAMRDTLAVSQVHAKTLTLTNTAPDTVTYRLSDDNALAKVRFSKPAVQPRKVLIPEVVRPKGSRDTAPSQTDSSGGPDTFGYRWIDSDSPGGPVFNWFNIDTAGRGTQITFSSNDDGNTTVPMGIPIPFYGNTYSTSLNVCTNGWVSFTSTSTAYSNTAIPDAAEPNNAIYPFWDDLNVTAGSVKYYYDAPGSRFIVQYTNVPPFSGTGTGTFQVILYPNGQIIMQYLSMSYSSPSATVGIENADGTVATQVAFSSSYIHNNLAIKYYLPDASWLSEAPSFGRINPGGTANITCTFDANGLTQGTTYNANIIMDITHPDVTGSQLIPASLRVISAGTPTISINPTSLTFPTTIIGNNRRDSLRVRNVGIGTLTISSVTTSNPRFAATITSSSLVSGDSARIRVVYTPVVPAGTDTGRVIVLSNDASNPRVDIPLTGTSVGSHIFRTYIDSLVKNMSGALLDSTRFYVRNAGTAAGSFNANAVMIPRTLDGAISGDPVRIPVTIQAYNPLASTTMASPPATGLAPRSERPAVKGEPTLRDALNLVGEKAFCVSHNTSTALVSVDKFNMATPGTFVALGSGSSDSFAGDFGNDGVWYGITYTANNLVRIDTTTGAFTTIGACPPVTGDTWTSLEVDPTTGIAYGTSANATTSSLYTINLTTGAPTLIGLMSGAANVISSAFSNSGQLYAVEQLLDNLVSVNKATGATTVIGAIGFDTRFAQDAAFDRSTNTMYLAAYNNTLAVGEFRSVNLATGSTTLIAPFPASEEVTNFAIKGSSGPSTTWLTVAPTSGGPVAVGDSTRLTAYFDTRSPGVYTLPGNYFGRVEVTNPGAPAADTLKIPVRMFLAPTAGADLVVSPDTIDVGNVEIGRTDSAKTVLIRNIGSSTLTVTGVTFTGTGAAFFASSRTAFTINSLDTLRIKVKFTATAPGGVRTARMNFTCNDPTPQSVGLRGVSVGVAHVTVRPDTFYVSRGPTPDTTFTSFKIYSTGTDTLRYTITESNSLSLDAAAIERSKTQQRVLSLGKGVADPSPGEGGTDGSGGPDAFGYRWIDSDEPGGPTYSWTDISGVGTALTFSGLDDGTAAVTLPFSFRFYGINYTLVNVCTNGHMSFTTTTTEYSNTAIPAAATPNGAVYGFWDDLNLTSGGTVYSYNDVANQRFVIQYTNVPYFSGTGTVTFQMILYANGTIRTQYNSVTTGVNNSCTVGIEDETGTVGLQVVFNATYLHDNLAILFTSDIVPWMSTNITSGTIAAGDSNTVSLRIHPFGLANGLYTGYQKVRGNTPDTTANVRVRANIVGGNSITVTSPNGGEVLGIGTVFPITWVKSGAVDSVKIEYSIAGNSGPWTLITGGVPARIGLQEHPKNHARPTEGGQWDNPNGLFNWTVPNTPSANCYVKVSWKSTPTTFDVSNAAFTIGTPPGDTVWVAQTAPTTLNLTCVKTIDINTAWAGGANLSGTSGIVIRTTDGGANWLSVGTWAADVYTITAVDANTAIAANYTTAFTRLVRTTNGGASWATVDSIPLGFYDYVHMFNATFGYAMGDPNPAGTNWVLKKTTNGGATWVAVTPVLPGPGTEAGWNNSMQWLDANNGWFGTNNTKIYRTTNGGTNWTSSAPAFANSYSVGFTALTTGLTGSDTGPFNKSTDGGATWVAGPASTGTANLGMWPNAGTQEFWVSSGNNVYYSSNAGTAWSSAAKNGFTGSVPQNHVNMVKAGSNLYGWAVGNTGAVRRYRRIINSAEEPTTLPTEFALSQNYPNPFNPSTKIKYDLPAQATVVLKIYNVLGQEVATLANSEQAAGRYEAVWDGRNSFGAPVSSGVYFYRFEATSGSGQTFANLKKMIFLK